MSEAKQVNVFKFTLSTEKTILLREPKIGDTEAAMKISGRLAGDNQGYMMVLFQKEMLKLLLVKVDDKTPSMNEKEALDNLFTLSEYNQATRALKMIAGDEEGEELSLTPEIMTL